METKSKWSKTCSFPKTIRAQVLAQVLENTREEENLVEVSQPIVKCISTIQQLTSPSNKPTIIPADMWALKASVSGLWGRGGRT